MSRRAVCRLLIVEDGAEDRMVYRVMLKHQDTRPFAVTLAVSGEDALTALAANTFDCMLLDHDLSDMTGLELLDLARRGDGTLPCPTVIVTGNSSSAIGGEALRRGARAVLLKDAIDEGGLLAAIETAMSAPAPPSPPPPPLGVAQPPRLPGGAEIAALKQHLAATLGVTAERVEIVIRF